MIIAFICCLTLSIIFYLIHDNKKIQYNESKKIKEYEGTIVKKESPIHEVVSYHIEINIDGKKEIAKSINYANWFKKYNEGDTVTIGYYLNNGTQEIRILDDELVPEYNHPKQKFNSASLIFFIISLLFLALALHVYYKINYAIIFTVLAILIFTVMIISGVNSAMSIIKKGKTRTAKILKKEFEWTAGNDNPDMRRNFVFTIIVDNKVLQSSDPISNYTKSLKAGDEVQVRIYKSRFMFEEDVLDIEKKKNTK